MNSNEYTDSQRYRPTLRDVLSIFFFYKRTFILTFLGVVLGALMLALLSSPSYETTARLVVKPSFDKPAIFQADTSRLSTSDRVDPQAMNTVVHLLTSTDVVRRVVEKHGLADPNDETEMLEAIMLVQDALTVEPLSMSNIIEVSLKGGDPHDVVEMLNSLLDSYIDYHIQVNQSLEGRLQFFDQQSKVFKSKYAQLGQELGDAHRRLNLVNPDIQGDNQLRLVRDMEVRRAELISLLSKLEQRQEYLNHATKNAEIEDGLAGLPSELRSVYPALIEMERSLAQLIINVQRARSDFLPGTKPTADAEKQYRNMHKKILDYLVSAVESIDLDMRSAQLELRQLTENIRQTNEGLGELSADALLLERINFEYRMAEENYSLYEKKREEARINQEKDRSNFANVSVASRPVAPLYPWFPQKGLIMLSAIVLGFLLATAVSAIRYFMDQTIRTPADILLRSRIRLLGTLDTL